jgi:hypothetical protein
MPVLRDLAVSQYCATVEDPRIDRTRNHALLDMIIITLCAVICGADSWVAVAAQQPEYGMTSATETVMGHGRIEARTVYVISAPAVITYLNEGQRCQGRRKRWDSGHSRRSSPI